MEFKKSISTLLALSITLSLVWCVDFDCLNCSQNGMNVATLSSNAGTHENTSTNSTGGHSDGCLCICHIPYVDYRAAPLDFKPAVEIIFVHTSLITLSVPDRTQYRPPIAA